MDSVGDMDIPGYRIVRKIGEGAMASVFLAVQESLGRRVALKVLAPAFAAQRDFTRRFLNEGRIIAYLKHPQIVNVYDLGSHGHNYYLSMELLSAGALEHRMKEGISVAQAVRIVKDIATALGFAHERGVIHRDIKPQNILFRDDDLPVLTDFGIARLIDGSPHLTIPGRTLGSPLYMSPEQINGHRIDGRADLYALGILLYNMLTGKLPYESDQIMTVALMHKTAPIPILPGELSALQPTLNRLLAKDPDDRFNSAPHLIDAMSQIELKFPTPEHGTGRKAAIRQPPIQGSVTGRVGLLDSSSIRPFNVLSHHELEPTMAASDKSETQPGQDPAGSLTDPGDPTMNRQVAAASFQGGSAWKNGALLSMAALAVALAVILFWIGPFSGSPQPTLKAVSAHRGNKISRLDKIQAGSSPGQPVKMTLSPPQRNQLANDGRVSDLLAKANKQLSLYHLTSPTGDNCYETYRQIVALDPGNLAAASIITRLVEAYRRLALAAKAEGRLDQGLQYVETGLKVHSEDPMLLALRAELHAGIADQTRIEIEQAKMAEQQERTRAVARKALEEKQRAERELAEQRVREVQPARMVRQVPEQGRKEPPEENIDQGQPSAETIGKEENRQSRLFGTF